MRGARRALGNPTRCPGDFAFSSPAHLQRDHFGVRGDHAPSGLGGTALMAGPGVVGELGRRPLVPPHGVRDHLGLCTHVLTGTHVGAGSVWGFECYRYNVRAGGRSSQESNLCDLKGWAKQQANQQNRPTETWRYHSKLTKLPPPTHVHTHRHRHTHATITAPNTTHARTHLPLALRQRSHW